MTNTESLSHWLSSPRFEGITRLHTAAQVAEQRGTIETDYPVARIAAEGFFLRLRELFTSGRSITTFGPYSPGQAVVMKRLGIEAIYLGGWATSAKGSLAEDPGADLASYPLSQVPDEAASIVRALLTADRNQSFARTRLTERQRAATPQRDYRPFIIADADTGHGGDAHVRNLIRRFVEVGVPGYHIEDQKPGAKKCGHQDGKVLVSQHEQIQRLNAARLQLDIMGVPGIIVSRTDAESAALLESNGDERDQPFILGATSLDVPSYRAVILALHRSFFERGVSEIRGHLMFAQADADYALADQWLTRIGATKMIDEQVVLLKRQSDVTVDQALDLVAAHVANVWETEAGLKTYREAVAHQIGLKAEQGDRPRMSAKEWLTSSSELSLAAARAKAVALGVEAVWDCERARTPEGYYQVQGGLEYAIAKSLTAAPFADILWMETKTANLSEARAYATAIHARFPDKLLAYNLSPSFNWDTTGMSEQEMRDFPDQLAGLGFVFNFITYAGHQIDGLAAEEFASSLRSEGMLALAKLQRRLRLLESPYRTPQTLVGGPRLDAALMAASGRTATTRAMGKRSTQHQHLNETEASVRLLDGWLGTADRSAATKLTARLRPLTGGSDVMELQLTGDANVKAANTIFVVLHDREGRSVLAIRETNCFDSTLQGTSCLALAHLFLIHRYHASKVQFLNPTAQEAEQSRELEKLGVLVNIEAVPSQFIVGDVDAAHVKELLAMKAKGASA